MSDEETDNFPMEEPKNVLWVETYYDHINPDEDNTNCNIIWESEMKKLPFMDMLLQFQFQRITDKKMRLTCIRTGPPHVSTDIKYDDGYNLQMQCSITILNYTYSIIFDMLGKRNIAYDSFHLKNPYKYQSFDSKILVKMIEYDALQSDVCLCQEQKFQKMRLKYFNDDSKLRDLCYILQVPMDESMFTGRQDFEFASLKRKYIKRTAMFSAQIFHYLKARDDCIPLPMTNLSLILNYILKGEQVKITDEDLIKAYLQAHRMGLKFFAYLSRDCILERIGDGNLVVDVMYAAECVNDDFLFHRVTPAYLSSKDPEKLSRLLQNSNVKCRFLLKALSTFIKQERLHHTVEEKSLPEFF